MPSYEELAASVAELRESLAARDSLIAELQRLLEEARRAGKRQSAPFSKGEPSDNPARPGRKKGKGHGRHGHRMAPANPDRVLDVPAPLRCPGCGGATELERIAEQWQTELPEPRPITTLFKVHVRRCRSCARRVQGRHPEQTSDALGAAGSQVGPRAMAWGAWLHYGLGLSFAKASKVLGGLGIDTSTPGGQLVANVFASVAEWEREMIASRTKDGLAALRAKGLAVSRPAVADRPELSRRIADLRQSGLTLQAVADKLNEEGVPTLRGGTAWRVSSVQAACGYQQPACPA